MASSQRSLSVAILIFRVLTLILLAISLIIIATNKIYVPADITGPAYQITFRDWYAYRYVLSVCVIGCAYTLLQMPFAAVNVAKRKAIGGSEGLALLLICFDVVFTLLIATGAAAGLGPTVDAQRFVLDDPKYADFLNLVDTSCGLMLGATICMVVIIMISVYSLKK